MSRLPASLAWALALWGVAASARAEPARVHLTFQHPVASMCPSAQVLESDVEALEGRTIFTPREDAEMLVRGGAEDLPTGVRVQLEARNADGTVLGTRELTAPAGQCASLRPALALVLSMLIDSDERPAAKPSTARAFALGAEAAMLSGALPRATAGFGLSLGVTLASRLRLRAHADYYLPVTIETARGVGAELRAFAFTLALCPRVSRDSTRFSALLCAGSQLGQLSASPKGLRSEQRQNRLLAQAMVELKLAVRTVADLWLEISAGPFVSLDRPRVSYTRPDGMIANVYRPSALGAILRVALIIDGL